MTARSTRPEPAVTAGRPWAFLPSLYFAEGLPNGIVTGMALLMYNDLGITKDQLGLWTSLIAFPWTLKMLWSPAVDLTGTRRRWLLGAQGLLALALLGTAAGLGTAAFFPVTLALLTVIAFLSATYDIATDGFYLLALGREAQAFFVGVRSTFYRLSSIFVNGGLVWLAGSLALLQQNKPEAADREWLRPLDGILAAVVADPKTRTWATALLVGAGVYLALWALNALLLPHPPGDRPRPRSEREPQENWGEAFRTFFAQPRIGWILLFIVFYRFGESMVGKLSGPFLQDPVAKGGLGIPTDQIGVISGTVGVLALVAGGILGGMVIAKFGIRRCLWPMVLCLNVPNLFYAWASLAKPGVPLVTALIAVDQFGYGFGFSAYMVYLMYISQGTRFQTSHYAIATGLMALGALAAGILSGYVQVWLGYFGFFVAVLVLGLPGMLSLLRIPLDREDLRVAPVELD